MWIIKLISFIWPFLKEMILGDKTVTETVRANKLKTLFVFMGVLSLCLNFLLVQRLVILGKNHLHAVNQTKKANECTPPVVKKEKEPAPTVVTPTNPTLIEETHQAKLTHSKRKNKHHEHEDPGHYAIKELTRIKENEDKLHNPKK